MILSIETDFLTTFYTIVYISRNIVSYSEFFSTSLFPSALDIFIRILSTIFMQLIFLDFPIEFTESGRLYIYEKLIEWIQCAKVYKISKDIFCQSLNKQQTNLMAWTFF